MARGGYRPGAGRPPGARVKPRKKKTGTIGDHPGNPQKKGKEANLTPLEYMLSVMNDETAEPDRRDRMAIMAVGLCHHRKGE